MEILIERETPNQREVLDFLRKGDEWLSSLYPSASRLGTSLDQLMAPNVRFFVARLAGRAMGCGGYALCADGTADAKRLFVDPHARRRGIGTALVEAIENAARREGASVLRLETGNKSFEALSLYRRLGYRERGSFGSYVESGLNLFMEKNIASSP
jgi:putative acetyltransferase